MRTGSPWATSMSRTPPTGAPVRNVSFVDPASALDAESDPPLCFRTTNSTTAAAIAAAAKPRLSLLDCIVLLSARTQPRNGHRPRISPQRRSAGGRERRGAAGEAEGQVQRSKRLPRRGEGGGGGAGRAARLAGARGGGGRRPAPSPP